MSGLVLLIGQLQKRVCRTVGPTLAASLSLPLKYSQCKSFYRCYFEQCSSKLAEFALLSYPHRKSSRCSDKFHEFSFTIPRCYKDVLQVQELIVSFCLWAVSNQLCYVFFSLSSSFSCSSFQWLFSFEWSQYQLTLPVPIPNEEKKINFLF